MELAKSETGQYLQMVLDSELRAAARYDLFAEEADHAGHMQIAELFRTTANHERRHALLWMRVLSGGKLPGTEENLRFAAASEQSCWQELYENCIEAAKREGFEQLSQRLSQIAAIERAHERRFRILAKNLAEGNLYRKADERAWVCRACGHLYEGSRVPAHCPVCGRPQGYFTLYCENY